MPTLTPGRAIELLREIVEEYGADYVYSELLLHYFSLESLRSDRTPSCLIGHVLYRAGWTYDDIGGGHNACRIEILGPHLGIGRDAIAILAAAQRVQDGRTFDSDGHYMPRNWGAALAAAETAYVAYVQGIRP